MIEDKNNAKKDLGSSIKKLRENAGFSQRSFAKKIGLPNSNLKYIEDGVNAPSAKVYENIISELQPNEQIHAKLDSLYSSIRGTPPPEICKFLIQNSELYKVIRRNSQKLNSNQIKKINETLELAKS